MECSFDGLRSKLKGCLNGLIYSPIERGYVEILDENEEIVCEVYGSSWLNTINILIYIYDNEIGKLLGMMLNKNKLEAIKRFYAEGNIPLIETLMNAKIIKYKVTAEIHNNRVIKLKYKIDKNNILLFSREILIDLISFN